MAQEDQTETIAVVGDVHGHLQLALCLLARWQRQLRRTLSAVLLCGDVGTFTDAAQLDSATVRHSRDNPCELEFLYQWCTNPPAPWLDAIFLPPEDGLGLTCPVVMVHGNHEGFAHLDHLAHGSPPADPVRVEDLPAVDSGGHLLYLPTGWRFRTMAGNVVAGIGGIEKGHRRAVYHRMAYLDGTAVVALSSTEPVDLLVSHQGPAAIHGEIGSTMLDQLLSRPAARVWCHGHGRSTLTPTSAGPEGRCLVVPLGDVAFSGRGGTADPGLDGFCLLTFADGEVTLEREVPFFWREYRRKNWRRTRDGLLVCPDLLPFVDHPDLEEK